VKEIPTDQRLEDFFLPPERFRLPPFRPLLFRPPLLRGTFAPFFLASDRPIAIACLRLLTFLPLPDFSVPFFRRRIALSTRFDALFPYLRLPEDFFAAMVILRSVVFGVGCDGLAHVVPMESGVVQSQLPSYPSSPR
jgi:hypothetical protein